jgi:DNA-binding transcriptional LysR family regulator
MNSFRHLEIIQALAVHKNFGRAASSIGMTQPVLSRMLAHIEKELGVKLFERGPGGASPTIFGQIIVDRCAETLPAIAEALREIRLTRDLNKGALIIAAGAFPAEISVQTAVGRMVAQYPKLSIQLSTGHFRAARQDVLDGRADIAIADVSDLLPHGHPDLDIEPHFSREVRFCCRTGHTLLKLEKVELSDFFSFPMAGVVWPSRVNHFLPADVSQAGSIDPDSGYFTPHITVDTLRGALAIVRESDATTFVHPSYIETDIRSRRLALIPLQLPWMTLKYGFITKKGRTLSPAAQAFRKCVIEIEAEIA